MVLARDADLTRAWCLPRASIGRSRVSIRDATSRASRAVRETSLEILERTENDAFVALAYHLLATTEVEAGNGGEALRLLEYGRGLPGSELGRFDEARFVTLEARALLLAGRPADGARAAERTLGSLDGLGPGDRGLALMTLADVFGAVGDEPRARQLLEEALELLLVHRPRRALEAARKLADLLEGRDPGALAVLARTRDCDLNRGYTAMQF